MSYELNLYKYSSLEATPWRRCKRSFLTPSDAYGQLNTHKHEAQAWAGLKLYVFVDLCTVAT